MYDETRPLLSNSNKKSSSATSNLCSFLYTTGAAAVAGTTTYLNSMYYLSTTQHILSQQIPGVDNSVVRNLVNTFGAAGASIRSISQMAQLITKIKPFCQQ